jgi:hypothetical protein
LTSSFEAHIIRFISQLKGQIVNAGVEAMPEEEGFFLFAVTVIAGIDFESMTTSWSSGRAKVVGPI